MENFPRNYSGVNLAQLVELKDGEKGSVVTQDVSADPAKKSRTKKKKKDSDAGGSGSFRSADARKLVPLIQTLNTRPTLAIFAIYAVVFVPISLFLDSFVAEATHSFAVFAVGSYLVWSSYFSFHYHLLKYSTSYGQIPIDKQFYVLSNFIKSALLLSYSPLAAKLLYEVVVYDEWNVVRIWNLGCLYAIPDFVSLLLVKRMAQTTVIHHVCVCIFMVVSLQNDYEDAGICQSIVIYAIWSDFSYLVNLLLASRFVSIHDTVSMWLSILAGIIYAVCCSINWTWQVQYIYKLCLIPGMYSVYVYVPMLLMIVRDDVVLLKWLYSNAVAKSKSQEGDSKKKA